jgi:Flp pilus assembly protein TadG
MNIPTTTGSKTVPAGWSALATTFVRLRRDRGGAVAIEFGIVALPFFALMFAILETALTFLAGQTLDTMVNQTARLIRTGQAQQQGFNADKFKTEVCAKAYVILNCSTGLKLDVQKYATFDSINMGVPRDADGNLQVVENYVPGHGGEIVVVRAYYEWPVIVPTLGSDLATEPNGKHLLVSTVAFRNEPFPW